MHTRTATVAAGKIVSNICLILHQNLSFSPPLTSFFPIFLFSTFCRFFGIPHIINDDNYLPLLIFFIKFIQIFRRKIFSNLWGFKEIESLNSNKSSSTTPYWVREGCVPQIDDFSEKLQTAFEPIEFPNALLMLSWKSFHWRLEFFQHFAAWRKTRH